MKIVAITLLCLCTVAAFAQPLQVTSTFPANNAVNVATGRVTLSFTFNTAVDTTTFVFFDFKGASGGLFTSADSVHSVSFSVDKRTVSYLVTLSAGKPYVACIYAGKTSVGAAIDHPYGVYFTTAATFPSTTVSGTVSSGSSGVSAANSLVALSLTPVGGGSDPVFGAGAIADAGGAFTIPHVPNGTYYPVAAKDLNNDGDIDPSRGDIVGLGTPFNVTGSNVSGVTIVFGSNTPANYKEALDSLNAHIAGFPSPRVLREVACYEIDTTGRGQWEFYYTTGSRQTSFVFRVDPLGSSSQPIDSNNYFYVSQWKPINSLPTVAAVDSFFARCERSGGKAYRPVPATWNGFEARYEIGDLSRADFYDMVSDTSLLYIGMVYWYGDQNQNQWITHAQRRFLGNFSNGNILGTTGVADNQGQPTRFSLDQNYPNPFNPSTVIGYALPADSRVSLTVYNVLGQKIATLVDGPVAAGAHQAEWRAQVSSGIYFYRLEASSVSGSSDRFVQTRKMILMK